MSARESSLKRQVMIKLAEIPQLVARKRWGGPETTVGDPDISGCYRGRHFEIELKREGEEPTPVQKARLAEWERAGAITGVAHTVDEVFYILGIEVAQCSKSA